jgi:hypothetical protein
MMKSDGGAGLRSMRWIAVFLPWALSVLGCRLHPCANDEKLVDSIVTVENGVITLESIDGWTAQGDYGTVSDSLLSECRGAAMSVQITGETPTLDVFEGFEEAWSSFTISGSGLDDVHLDELRFVGGSLALGGTMERITGLNAVTEVGSLNLGGGNGPVIVEGLTSLEVVHGRMTLEGVALTAVPGLRNVRSVGEHLHVWAGGLVDGRDLDGIETVAGDAEIFAGSMTTLGFNSLRTIGWSAEWNGLSALESIGRDIEVRPWNVSLCDGVYSESCYESGAALCDDVRSWARGVDIGGAVDICGESEL